VAYKPVKVILTLRGESIYNCDSLSQDSNPNPCANKLLNLWPWVMNVTWHLNCRVP